MNIILIGYKIARKK